MGLTYNTIGAVACVAGDFGGYIASDEIAGNIITEQAGQETTISAPATAREGSVDERVSAYFPSADGNAVIFANKL